MFSEIECDRSTGVVESNLLSKCIEFVDDDLKIDIDNLISEIQARSYFEISLNNYSNNKYLKRTSWEEIFKEKLSS